MRKVGVWTILGAGLLNAVGHLPQTPGTALVRDLVQPGAYLIVAGAAAAAAHDRKDLVLLVLGVTLLAAYPFDLQDVARLLIPMGIGITVGSILRSTIKHEQPEARHERPTR